MAKSKLISSIDIGSSKTAVLICQFRDDDSGGKLNIVGAASSKSRGVKKGQIVNIEEAVGSITEAVEAAERMAGYNLSKAWISVNGSHIGSQNSHGVVAVSNPRGEITPEDSARVLEAARAVSLPTAAEIVHVLPMQYTVDNQEGVRDPVNMTGVRLEVDTHIVTGSSPVMKNLTKCVSEVGCDISGMVFSGLAAAESVLSDTEKELGVVLVDIGGGTMSLAIFVEGALSYSSVLPVGAINVTKDIAAGLRISLESAEKLKLFMRQDKSREDDMDVTNLNLPEGLKTVSRKTIIEGIVRPRLNEMCQLISAEIKKSTYGGLTPSGLVITGGGALTTGITDSAKRILGIPVRIGSPTGIIGLVDEIDNPTYAGAVGLLKYAKNSLEETESPGAARFLTNLAPGNRLPLKGVVGKAVNLIKSLLP